ncbi:apoptotic protease-activating factor 1 isoform X4 [Carcharodon carcharias]|uniref:apoptotic protease-activating factor 1 isoform X4 n=1 Tax=Carcharodon carcharias TaxID=13397 RepID=UPI001B7F1FBA|nr:apoptotic protease-activating factor 1 isoform X4 [Carcharodon carcharias]
MEERTRSCLLQNRSALEQDIKTSYIMDHLISEEVLSLDDEQKVKSQATQKERAASLLSIILEKDNYAVISFYNALLNEGYKELAALLQDCLPIISTSTNKSSTVGLTAYVQTILCEGGVPQRPVVFVDRPEIVQSIRNALYKLEEYAGWITIYGMAGCGKSVLAAEALRNHRVITECFPGGVHWVAVGKQDRAGILVKLQNLCSRLNQGSHTYPSPPLNTEEARDRLRFLMARKYPRSLLVLDDVWDSWVLKCFDVQCRVLITSRDKNITEAVTGNNFPMSVQSGLSNDKGLEILARFVNSKVASLPKQAHSIVQECKVLPWKACHAEIPMKRTKRKCVVPHHNVDGTIDSFITALTILIHCSLAMPRQLTISELDTKKSAQGHKLGSPLIVSLIGALLREFPTRWNYYLNQLQNKQFKRIRKSSSYDYEALDEAMAVSIEVLKEDYKEYYKDLSILAKDVKVPTKVLCILWALETEEVEDILQVFVNKSLLFCDRNGNSFQYYLHDLQLDFLTEQNRKRLPDLHAKMVRQYQKTYKRQFPSPSDEDCMYWYSFLANHMAKANMDKELYLLMFSMDWIKAKTELMGPAQLINDFVEYRHILDEENSAVRENFQEFLSLKGHLLVQKPFPDIVQLGLCQPDSSEVYRQAKLQAVERAKKGAVYLEWMNRKTLQNLSRLVVRPHSDAVFHACFSCDGLKIASCGADKTLQIFKSGTGEKLLEVLAHDDEVLCCAFSPDDKFIATCSSDTKVKVWNVLTGQLFQTYHEHNEQVNHCRFSHSQHRILLATCSNDKFLKIWDLEGTSCRNTLFGHMDYVNHCSFSPDDQYLASCSNDGTVKLWNTSSANEWKCFDVNEQFRKPDEDDDDEEEEVLLKCCTWSSDGAQIMAAAKNIIFVFDVMTGDLIADLMTSSYSTIQSCDVSLTSPLLAVALSHNSVELWNLELRKRVADCSGHLSWVHCVQFSLDGSALLSSSDDQTVRLWDTNKVHSSSAVSLVQDMDAVFQEGEVTVLVSDNKKCLQLINGKTGDVMCQSEVQDSRIRCCCLDQHINLAAFGCGDGILKVLELPSGKILKTLIGHTECVQRCQFTPDGMMLISSSDDATIRIWNWRTEECKVLEGHTEQVKNFKLLREPQLLSWSFDGTVKVWNYISGELLKNYDAHKGATVLSCDASSSGSEIASASADKSAKIWSLNSTLPLHVLTGHNACVRSCKFTWDNKSLATGDDNGEIRIWRVQDGSLLHICSEESENKDSKHGGWVTDLHFSLNSKMLVSTGGYIKWWDMNTGESLQTFYTNGTNLKSIHVSSDFKTYVTIDNIGILYILKMIN